MSHRLFYCRFH